jgi:hypothetical protein
LSSIQRDPASLHARSLQNQNGSLIVYRVDRFLWCRLIIGVAGKLLPAPELVKPYH